MFSPQEIVQFKRICYSFGINLSQEMIDKFETYTDLLLEWNQRIHLISKKDAASDRILRHFVDSLSIFKVIDLPNDTYLLDVGAGAGFPSIPIEIVRKDIHLTLVESVRKKTFFLQKLSEVLKLQKISILNQRAEKLTAQADFEERFDLVTARALGNLEDVARLSMPFLRTGGLLVAYKGKGVKKDIEEIDGLNDCRIQDVVQIAIREMDLLRCLVMIEKVK